MDINYTWADEQQTLLRRTEAGEPDLFIPVDGGNRFYTEYLRWCEDGNVASPFLKPTVIEGVTDLVDGKKYAVEAVRLQAHELLVPTDWVVTREMETGVPAPATITDYRAAVRAASAEKISTIEGKQKLSTLQDYLRSAEFAAWPEAPTA